MDLPTTKPVLLEENKELSFLPEFLQNMHEYKAIIAGGTLFDKCLCDVDIFVFDTTGFNRLYSRMMESDYFKSIAMSTADETMQNIVKKIYGKSVTDVLYNIFLVSPDFEMPKPDDFRDGSLENGSIMSDGGIYFDGNIYSDELAMVYLANKFIVNTESTYFDTENGLVIGVNAPGYPEIWSNKFNLYTL